MDFLVRNKEPIEKSDTVQNLSVLLFRTQEQLAKVKYLIRFETFPDCFFRTEEQLAIVKYLIRFGTFFRIAFLVRKCDQEK